PRLFYNAQFGSYHCAVADRHRVHIFEHELFSLSFGFFFKAVRDIGTSTVRLGTYDSTFQWTCTFHPGGAFETSDPYFELRHPDGLHWAWVDGCGLDRRYLQVVPFPALEVSRTPQGGWRLENAYVVLLSDVAQAEDAELHYGPGAASRVVEEEWVDAPVSQAQAARI
ncbi:unnamed protein product, partial [Polarella glacialis]